MPTLLSSPPPAGDLRTDCAIRIRSHIRRTETAIVVFERCTGSSTEHRPEHCRRPACEPAHPKSAAMPPHIPPQVPRCLRARDTGRFNSTYSTLPPSSPPSSLIPHPPSFLLLPPPSSACTYANRSSPIYCAAVARVSIPTIGCQVTDRLDRFANMQPLMAGHQDAIFIPQRQMAVQNKETELRALVAYLSQDMA